MAKDIKLLSMTLDKFRDVTTTIKFGAKRNQFYGRNGAGKTTLFDAHCFVTTGKSSEGKLPSDPAFGIKKLKNGQNNPKDKHSATEVWEVDGKQIGFGRTYYEKWSKKRNEPEPVKTGNTTDLFINGDKVTPSQFTAKFAETFGSYFFLCSDGRYLPSLNWKERRKILIDMIGVDEGSFVAKIEGLEDLLEGRQIDAARTAYEHQRKETNDKLANVNPKIEEYQKKGVSNDQSIGLENAEEAVKIQKERVDKAQKAIDDFKSGLAPAASSERLKTLRKDLEISKNEFFALRDKAKEKERTRKSNIEDANFTLNSLKKKLTESLEIREAMRQARKRMKESSPSDIPESCDYCGTKIEEPQIEYITEGFNVNKSEWLEKDKVKGLALGEEIEKLQGKIKAQVIELESLNNIKPDPIINASTNDTIKQLEIEIDRLTQVGEQDRKEVPQELTESLEQAQFAHDQAVETRANLKAKTSDATRLKELIEEKKALSATLDKCLSFSQKYETYTNMLADAVEKPVNELFKKTHFKMFSVQENGNVIPDCVVMDKNLKPYLGVLSNGERVQIEADIVATMQKHFGCYPTAWFDNVDGVSDPIELNCQVIELHHDRNFAELTHKTEDK